MATTGFGEQWFRHKTILNTQRIAHRRAEIFFNLGCCRHLEKLIAIEVLVNRDGEYMKSFLAEAQRKQKQEAVGSFCVDF
jgi:hypothetical protein